MVVFDSSAIYIASKKSLCDKITAIDAIIAVLLTTCLEAAASGNVTEYDLDTGQTKIKAAYRNPGDVMKAVMAFEELKNYYVNQLNGGTRMRLVDSSNFTGPYYGRFRR